MFSLDAVVLRGHPLWTSKLRSQPRGLSIRAKTRVSMDAFRVGVDGDTVEVVGAHGPRGLGTDIRSFPIQAPPSTVVFVLCHPSHWPEPSHGTTKETKPGCTARIHSKDSGSGLTAVSTFRLVRRYRLSLTTCQSWMTRNGPKWTEKSGVEERTQPHPHEL